MKVKKALDYNLYLLIILSMLTTLQVAKEYALDRISQITWEELVNTERMVIQTSLEDKIRNKLYEFISDDEIDALKALNDDDLEGKLFYKIPNYINIIGDTTAQFLAEYLSSEIKDEQEES